MRARRGAGQARPAGRSPVSRPETAARSRSTVGRGPAAADTGKTAASRSAAPKVKRMSPRRISTPLVTDLRRCAQLDRTARPEQLRQDCKFATTFRRAAAADSARSALPRLCRGRMRAPNSSGSARRIVRRTERNDRGCHEHVEGSAPEGPGGQHSSCHSSAASQREPGPLGWPLSAWSRARPCCCGMWRSRREARSRRSRPRSGCRPVGSSGSSIASRLEAGSSGDTVGTDRRRHALYLSPLGRKALDQITVVGADHERAFTRALGPAERDELIRLLERIAGAEGLIEGVHPGFDDPEADQTRES